MPPELVGPTKSGRPCWIDFRRSGSGTRRKFSRRPKLGGMSSRKKSGARFGRRS